MALVHPCCQLLLPTMSTHSVAGNMRAAQAYAGEMSLLLEDLKPPVKKCHCVNGLQHLKGDKFWLKYPNGRKRIFVVSKLPPIFSFVVVNVTQNLQMPKAHYFVLGDNPLASNDSRIFGPLPLDSIHCKPIWAWNLDGFKWVDHNLKPWARSGVITPVKNVSKAYREYRPSKSSSTSVPKVSASAIKISTKSTGQRPMGFQDSKTSPQSSKKPPRSNLLKQKKSAPQNLLSKQISSNKNKCQNLG